MKPSSLLARMMNGIGMLRNKLVTDTTRTMQAFLAEAEERFGEICRSAGEHSERGTSVAGQRSREISIGVGKG